VLYLGKRNGKWGWYGKKWEGEESEDNKDITKYEGEIKNGLPNGQGTSTHSNGSKFIGSWKNGKEWDLKGYNRNGNITGKYVNGKYIK